MAGELSVYALKRLWSMEETLVCEENLCILTHKLQEIRGLSTTGLATYLGISRSTLYQINGKQCIVFHSKVKLFISYIGITTDDLVSLCEVIATYSGIKIYSSYRLFNNMLSQAIKSIRRSTGIPPRVIATELGINIQQYNRLESGTERLINPCAYQVLRKANINKKKLLSLQELIPKRL